MLDYLRQFLLGAISFLALSNSCWAQVVVNNFTSKAALTKDIRNTLSKDPACKNSDLGDFYFAMGNGNSVLMNGKVGSTYQRGSEISFASVSKIIFAAYALEVTKGRPSNNVINGLRQTDGYSRMPTPYACFPSDTVNRCFSRMGYNRLESANAGTFSYNAAHFFKVLNTDLAHANVNGVSLTNLYTKHLGIPFNIDGLNPAGSVEGRPIDLENFLMNLVAGEYHLKSKLGTYLVCATPSCNSKIQEDETFPIAIEQNWKYSLGHWKENGVDGAFSSPGMFGTYPWISASKNHWGILVREDRDVHGGTAHLSVRCGQKLRQVFLKHLE